MAVIMLWKTFEELLELDFKEIVLEKKMQVGNVHELRRLFLNMDCSNNPSSRQCSCPKVQKC